MFGIVLCILLTFTAPCIQGANEPKIVSFQYERDHHRPLKLTNDQALKLSNLSDVAHLNEVLDNICIVRIVGTPAHTRVKAYIKKSMKELGWSVETDVFQENTPILGELQFENIIAKLNPNAKRFLALACHYDSKYTKDRNFEGATDSAVPCAQMINLAKVMKRQLKSLQQNDVSLMFIFFDGEEAFQEWGPTDSIYGAKHLANAWHNNKTVYADNQVVSELQRVDTLVLLDLLGAPDPTFYNYFSNTEKLYTLLMGIETQLANLEQFEAYSYGHPTQNYFQPHSVEANIEDDHLPFLKKNTPILHLIPYPFPKVWHKITDNRSNIDLKTTENMNKILRVFVGSYLHINL